MGSDWLRWALMGSDWLAAVWPQRVDIEDLEDPARWRAVRQVITEDYFERLRRGARRRGVEITEQGLMEASPAR
eukprot:2004383-Pyramimonas_sp.AAC.1